MAAKYKGLAVVQSETSGSNEVAEQPASIHALDGTPHRAQLHDQPIDSPHHDILIVGAAGVRDEQQFVRVPVTKTKGSSNEGHYLDMPEQWDARDAGQRKVVSMARPQDSGPSEFAHLDRGPAFATLSVGPEPAAAGFCTCYLVNQQNLNYKNEWTQAPWNAPHIPEAESVEPSNSMEVLLAAPQGRVLHLRVDDVAAMRPGTRYEVAGEGGAVTLEVLDLSRETEIWYQLRNGCVAGRALLNRERRVVPLVNVTSLQVPAQEGDEANLQ